VRSCKESAASCAGAAAQQRPSPPVTTNERQGSARQAKCCPTLWSTPFSTSPCQKRLACDGPKGTQAGGTRPGSARLAAVRKPRRLGIVVLLHLRHGVDLARGRARRLRHRLGRRLRPPRSCVTKVYHGAPPRHAEARPRIQTAHKHTQGWHFYTCIATQAYTSTRVSCYDQATHAADQPRMKGQAAAGRPGRPHAARRGPPSAPLCPGARQRHHRPGGAPPPRAARAPGAAPAQSWAARPRGSSSRPRSRPRSSGAQTAAPCRPRGSPQGGSAAGHAMISARGAHANLHICRNACAVQTAQAEHLQAMACMRKGTFRSMRQGAPSHGSGSCSACPCACTTCQSRPGRLRRGAADLGRGRQP